MKKRWQVIGLKVAAWFVGAIVALLVVVQIILSPAVATRLVNKYAPQFIDADLTFGKAGISLIRNFPNLSVRLSDALLTYPHDRFAEFENDTLAVLMGEGRCVEADTLASFDMFVGAVSVPALITKTVKVKKVELYHPRVFAKAYNDSTTNWNVFKTSDKEEKDTTSSNLGIKINTVKLADNAHIVYCSPDDSLFAQVNLKEAKLKGKVALSELVASKGQFSVDDLSVEGNLKADTLLFSLKNLDLKGSRKNFSLDADATAYAATRGYGRLTVPLSVAAKASYPQDSIPVIHVKKLKADVGGIPLEAKGDAILYSDKYFVDADVAMKPIEIGKLIRSYGPNFWADAGKIESDAKIYFNADVEGYYVPDTKELPLIDATLSIPDSYIRYQGVKQSLHLLLDARAQGGAGEPVNVHVDKVDVSTDGLEFGADADVKDILGEDPDIRLDAKLLADVAKAMGVLPADSGIRAYGDVDAALSAKALLSQLNVNRIGNAEVSGHLLSDCFVFEMPKDGLTADVDGLDIKLGVTSNRFDESMAPDARVLMLSAVADTLNAEYKDMFIRAGKFTLDAQNSADILSDMELSMTNVRPFAGANSFGSIRLRDADSTTINVFSLKDSFYMRPKGGNKKIPSLEADLSIGQAFIRSDANRLTVNGVDASVAAAMKSRERHKRVDKVRDSLSRIYPDIPKDSVMRYAREQKKKSRNSNLPEWLQEEDFRAKDLNLKLSKNIARYFNEWDLNGGFRINDAGIVTPYLPLKNTVSKAVASFNNERIDLRSLHLESGTSDLSASGSLSNLKKALNGKGAIVLDLTIKSDVLNANEFLAALDAGSKVTDKDIKNTSKLDDDEYESTVVTTEYADTTIKPALIVVPSNVVANIFLDANRIQYSTIDFDWAQAELTMKERCVQITNMIAMSNIGNVYCEAFYSTRTKQNIKAGITIDLEDITAERVLELLPAVDSLVPMLKSFTGLLNCSVAATTSLDEEMNILFPTLKGVIRIGGSDLLVDELGDLSRITKLLMFRNKNQIAVDHMEVNGLIADNKVEVFPFVLDVDRYKLALSGIQNIDKSFQYHVSVMRWPLLFKFGIDLDGSFDKFKFHLGKAKYRREKKVPTFEAVVDDSKANLKDIIHNIFKKSVDNAIEEYHVQQAVAQYKDSLHYVPATEQPLDTLSGRNAEMFQKLEAISGIVDLETADFDSLDSLQVAKLDSLGVTAADLKKMAKEYGDDED